MNTRNHLQTMAAAYAAIRRGEDPWIALGNFMNDWFDHAKDQRAALVADPLTEPSALTADLHRWAAFCAASVEYLCQRYDVPCPGWVYHPSYHLPEPWFYYPQAKARAHLLRSTPEPFTRRNIYCGDRMFLNKYELAEQYPRSSYISPPDTGGYGRMR
jgi:hypothetical protein